MSRGRHSLEHYARAVERLWASASESPAILSPRDFKLIGTWFDREVPLAVIQEALAVSASRPRPPRSLKSVAHEIDAAWATISTGRVPTSEAVDSATTTAPETAWQRCRRRTKQGSPLALLLERLLARHARGAAAAEIDAELDRELPDVVPAELRRPIDAELECELEPYRARMSADRWETTRRRALVDRLRRELELARLHP